MTLTSYDLTIHIAILETKSDQADKMFLRNPKFITKDYVLQWAISVFGYLNKVLPANDTNLIIFKENIEKLERSNEKGAAITYLKILNRLLNNSLVDIEIESDMKKSRNKQEFKPDVTIEEKSNDNYPIFISHINEDKNLAINLKNLLESTFGDKIEVFVSSDINCIPFGSDWFHKIRFSLSNCKMALILCSPRSIGRPWINFETGAAFIRGITVIPLCCNGQEVDKLPVPLNRLQAVNAKENNLLQRLFEQISKEIGVDSPNIDIENSHFYQEILKSDELGKDFGAVTIVAPGDQSFIPGEDIKISGTVSGNFSLVKLKAYSPTQPYPPVYDSDIKIETNQTFHAVIETMNFEPVTHQIVAEIDNGSWASASVIIKNPVDQFRNNSKFNQKKESDDLFFNHFKDETGGEGKNESLALEICKKAYLRYIFEWNTEIESGRIKNSHDAQKAILNYFSQVFLNLAVEMFDILPSESDKLKEIATKMRKGANEIISFDSPRVIKAGDETVKELQDRVDAFDALSD